MSSNAIIGAEAAKLAGLQMDTLAKVRAGIITLAQWEWFNNVNDAERNRICGFPSPRKNLNLKKFLLWLKHNGLDRKLAGGLMGQIAEQEKFYQRFYGKDFRIYRKKIFIDPRRLLAIRAGLEAGCLNYALVKATPVFITNAEAQMTGAQFFYKRFIGLLKKDGFKIWAENGTGRWTNLALGELLQRCDPADPEEFDADAFWQDWVSEGIRLLTKKGAVTRVVAGVVEIIFISNLVDIHRDQAIINKSGETVELRDRSYVSVVANNVRVLSHEEGIILATQLYARDKTCLSPSTWEWRRDIIDHRDRGTNPGVSIGSAHSYVSELNLSSSVAGGSYSGYRLRLAL